MSTSDGVAKVGRRAFRPEGRHPGSLGRWVLKGKLRNTLIMSGLHGFTSKPDLARYWLIAERMAAQIPPARSTGRRLEPGIKLKGVSRTVAGRRHERGRVKYDSQGGGRTPERIVVERCRSARLRCLRLPPWIWRAMAELHNLERRHPMEPLDALLQQLAPTERPRAGLVRALRALPQRRLDRLMSRHMNGNVDPRKPGVPDLFVFKTAADGRVSGPRFVEVKRPDERLLPHQAAELAFMRSIGFRAGVLRLRESRTS